MKDDLLAGLLAHLNDLGDEAAVHIWPDHLERCAKQECAVEVYSVRMGSPSGNTVPLFSLAQIAEAYRLSAASHPQQELIDAAQAVIERWDTPKWKDVAPTAEYIARLRRAVAASHSQEAALAQPVARVRQAYFQMDDPRDAPPAQPAQEAIQKRIRDDPEFARRLMRKAGIVDESGNLTPKFGGDPASAQEDKS